MDDRARGREAPARDGRDRRARTPRARAGFGATGKRSVLVVGGREGEWRKLGGKEGYGAVEADGTILVVANLRSGWRTQGSVTVDDALRGDHPIASALLAAVLAMRKLEEQAAAAA